MFFKNKCPNCGKINSKNAVTCTSCGISLGFKQTNSKLGNVTINKNFNNNISTDPKNAEEYYKRGFEYQKLGQIDQAISDFNKAILINPTFVYAYNNRGYAYLKKKLYDLTIADCTKVINLDPNDSVSRFNRGVAYELKGNKAEAIVDFEKVLKMADNPQMIKMAKEHIKELSR